MTYGEKAKQNFENGYNCAQAVLLAFSDVTGLDESMAMKLAASMGGGMGRLREVCGAVSGMFLVAGLLYAEGEVVPAEAKAAHYARVQDLAARFKAETGSYLCRELLEGVPVTTGSAPEERTEQYYHRRPCGELCRLAADIMAEYMEEQKR